jgi:hypothetical protein
VKRAIHAAVLICAAYSLSIWPIASYAQTSDSYWISMRSFAAGATQNFVAAATAATGQQTVAVQACDANTYYLSQSDYDSLQAALTSQETVQLTVGAQGSAPDASSIICLIQAAPG